MPALRPPSRAALLCAALSLTSAGQEGIAGPPAQTPPAQAPPAQAPPAPTTPPPRTAPAQSPPANPAPPAHAAGQVGSQERTLELTLQQALQLATDRDLGLRIEEINTDVSGYVYAASWGSFDPVLTARAAATSSEFESTSQTTGVSVLEENTYEYGAGLNVPLRTGGSLNAEYSRVERESNSGDLFLLDSTQDTVALTFRQPLLRGAWVKYATSQQRESEVEYGRSREHLREVRHQVLFDVELAYWDLVASIELLGVAEETLELGRQQLDQNKRRLEAGVGTEVEVLQADANVAVRTEERLLADVNVRAAQDRLKAKLYPGTDKRHWDTVIVPVTPLPESEGVVPPPWDVALLLALQYRSELRQQRLEIAASDIRFERTRSERNVGLDLELGTVSRGLDTDRLGAFDDATTFEFPANRAVLLLDVPIGNRTATNLARAERARGRAARLVYDQLESQIAAEVRAAVRQIQHQSEAIKASVVSLELARRQLDAEKSRFAEGLSTNFQVLEFQQQLAEALSSEKAARVNFAKALAGLEKAQGTMGDQN